MIFQRQGYERDRLFSNLALGFFDGIDSVLWCYAFAIIVFTGSLGLFLPLGVVIILGGWALLSICLALTSRVPVHMIAIDEQAVVIIGSIALLLNAQFGADAASPRGLATILAIMSLVSLLVALGFFAASRFHLAQLLELMPYPVVCGFMAGIGWLLLDAGVMVALDTPISPALWQQLQAGEESIKLAIFLGSGLFLMLFTWFVEKSWSLPLASTIVVVSFFGLAYLLGHDVADLRAGGWMFEVPATSGGVWAQLATLSPRHIDWSFILSVTPQIATILFLTLLAASLNLSAMTVVNPRARIKPGSELNAMGGGNLLCALIGSPPGYSDAPASILYQGFGATARWMPLASSCVCLLVAFSGDWFIAFTPKVLIGATIFLFAFQLFYDWMHVNVRSFGIFDYVIVCCILATVIGFGFMQGILLGIILTVLLFVLRYSLIQPIQDQYSLIDHRSSVERSVTADDMLEAHGGEALIYTLRGYLFFGTANRIRDAVRDSIDHGRYRLILLDLRRVSGIDISAMNAFTQIRQICDSREILLLYSCIEQETRDKLIALGAVSEVDGEALVFDESDYAIEYMEQYLLDRYTAEGDGGSIRHHLQRLLQDDDKVQLLMQAMIRIEQQAGDYLFRQGDPDTGFFILESGALSATIDTGRGLRQRVKKFSPGSVIGELSSYTVDGTRTASVYAEIPSVLYYLNPDSLADKAIVHELVARTLGVRMDYMNRRLLWELI